MPDCLLHQSILWYACLHWLKRHSDTCGAIQGNWSSEITRPLVLCHGMFMRFSFNWSNSTYTTIEFGVPSLKLTAYPWSHGWLEDEDSFPFGALNGLFSGAFHGLFVLGSAFDPHFSSWLIDLRALWDHFSSDCAEISAQMYVNINIYLGKLV